MINYFSRDWFRVITFAIAMNIGLAYCDAVTKNASEFTTDEEYTKYGVIHKKDIGCAGEYRAKRAEGLYAFYRYKKSLRDPMYVNVNSTDKKELNKQGIAHREGVCLRNASAIGDIKAVTWLLKQYCIFDVPSVLAASALAKKNGHSAIAKLLEEEVISLEKACRFVRSCGWSLVNERQRVVEKQYMPIISHNN
jgi:hypothetical protein